MELTNISKKKTMMSYDELVEENKLLRKDVKELKREVKMLRYTVDRLMASINLMYEAGLRDDEL